MRDAIRYLAITAMIAVICVSGYKLWKMSERYVQENQLKDNIMKYRPEEPENLERVSKTEEYCSEKTETTEPEEIKINNQFITDMQSEVNKDIIGWLTVPNTQIDYPFVTAEDNEYYLRKDLYGDYAVAGTIFMDYRCNTDFFRDNFSSFNTIIYGHNMKNGSMFGELPQLFGDEGFFDSNRTGTIYTKDNTYKLEFFACVVINAEDEVIYGNIDIDSQADRDAFFKYVRDNARNYREPKTDENIVTLSTCSYQFDGARTVLLANILSVSDISDKKPE